MQRELARKSGRLTARAYAAANSSTLSSMRNRSFFLSFDPLLRRSRGQEGLYADPSALPETGAESREEIRATPPVRCGLANTQHSGRRAPSGLVFRQSTCRAGAGKTACACLRTTWRSAPSRSCEVLLIPTHWAGRERVLDT